MSRRNPWDSPYGPGGMFEGGKIQRPSDKVIERHRWIAYVGLALILFIAARMIWHGVGL